MSDRPLTILLVEDNPADRRLVRETVAETAAGGGRKVEIRDCERLSEALEMLREPPDCVLLDLSLPDASGVQAVDEVRRAASHVPLVVLSGLDDEQAALAALSGGAQDYLLKGESDGRLIVRAVRYAIERKRAELEQEATQLALHQSERRQREILAGILQAEEAERSRIATSLHDDTVQVMTASLIALDRLALVARESGEQRIESAVMFARATLEEATDRTRRLMFELRPAILHERGLRAAIAILTEQMARETGARSVVSGDVGRSTITSRSWSIGPPRRLSRTFASTPARRRSRWCSTSPSRCFAARSLTTVGDSTWPTCGPVLRRPSTWVWTP